MWTRFYDRSSGGSQKEDFKYCYIEASEEEATVIFYNRFGRNPTRISCTCCGEDYSISSDPSLQQLTAFERGCLFVRDKRCRGGGYYVEKPAEYPSFYQYQTLDKYLKNKNVKVIHAKDIKEDEKEGEVPEQGFVWVD